ncbi:hypothetical protein EMCRGX_G019865 [Ephydatia muelleri]
MLAAGRSVGKLLGRGLSCRLRLNSCAALPRSCLALSASGSNHNSYSPPCLSLHTNAGLLKLQPFNLPDVGEAIETVEVKEWLTKPGDRLSMGDPVCEVQSDKSSVVIYTPLSGVVRQLMYKPGDVAHKGKPLVMIDVEDEGTVQVDQGAQEDHAHTSPSPSPTPAASDSERSAAQSASLSHDNVLTTPAVRRIARENSIDLRTVVGTGRDGRVLKEDVLKLVEGKWSVRSPYMLACELRWSYCSFSTTSTSFKAVMVRTMTASGRVPQFGYSDEVEVSRLVELQGVLKAELGRKGIKFSYMPIFVKALSLALLQYPILNSHVDEACTTITHKSCHNIGIAMDTPEGLIVPNIKGVEQKSVLEIAVDLNRLQELGLKGQLLPSDITGGTFSLSNIGNVGGTYLRPLLLPPEVAIGGLGKIQVLPRFDENGNVTKAHVVRVNWSADHRVIDGATVARFSNVWKSFVNNPATMIVNMM